MTVDVEGGVWVAVWGSGSVRRYRPNGSLDRTLRLGARQPTSVCLGGTDGRDLFITSASVGLGHVGSADGAVFRTSVDVPAPPAPPAQLD